MHEVTQMPVSSTPAYNTFSLPTGNYGFAEGSLQLVHRDKENLGLVHRWFCMIVRHDSEVDGHISTVFWNILKASSEAKPSQWA